jgi:hypothetical protein
VAPVGPGPMRSAAPPSLATSQDGIRERTIAQCITILQNVLGAIQTGANPVPVILRGLADLYQA